MALELFESDRFQQMEKVADLTLKGHTATAIAKTLNIPRKEVMTLQEDYRTALANDHEARDMARDYLNLMVKHYDNLINSFYQLIDDIDSLAFNDRVAAQKNAALKAIADLDAKRVDALQKAGLLDSAELGDEIAKWEEEKESMLSILMDLCAVCQPKVADRMRRLRGEYVPDLSEDAITVEVVEV